MIRWPARRVVGEARYPSARGCAGGAIGTETVPAVGGLRDSAGAPWERGDVARTSALPPPNHALERTGHSGHPWPAWGCPCGPPLTASVGLHYGDTLGRKIKATWEHKQEQCRGGHVCNVQ